MVCAGFSACALDASLMQAADSCDAFLFSRRLTDALQKSKTASNCLERPWWASIIPRSF